MIKDLENMKQHTDIMIFKNEIMDFIKENKVQNKKV